MCFCGQQIFKFYNRGCHQECCNYKNLTEVDISRFRMIFIEFSIASCSQILSFFRYLMIMLYKILINYIAALFLKDFIWLIFILMCKFSTQLLCNHSQLRPQLRERYQRSPLHLVLSNLNFIHVSPRFLFQRLASHFFPSFTASLT